MRDIHTERPKAGPIPILSPILHCVAMTGVVFLRGDFGWAFVGPKIIFLAISWALVMVGITAWRDSDFRREYWAFVAFAFLFIVLYWGQTLLSALKHFRKDRGEHDHESGRSFLLPIAQRCVADAELAELHLHLWVEPLILALAGAILRLAFAEKLLSTWLLIVSVALFLNEYLSFWLGHVRRKKVAKDIAEDAKEQTVETSSDEHAVPKATRTKPVKIPRFRRPN